MLSAALWSSMDHSSSDICLMASALYLSAPAKSQPAVDDYSPPEPKQDTKKPKTAGVAQKKVWMVAFLHF